MSDILFLIAGLAAGALIGVLYSKSARAKEYASLVATEQAAVARRAELESELRERNQKIDALTAELRTIDAERAHAHAVTLTIEPLRRQLIERDQTIATLHEEVTTLSAEIAEVQMALEKEREAANEKLDLLNQAAETMRDAFAKLSHDALRQNNQSFVDLATQTLSKFNTEAKGDLEKRQQAIVEVVNPVREQLDKFATAVRDLETRRTDAYSTLTEQVRALMEGQRNLSSETANLVKALRAPQTRGRWGEIQLRRVVELAGMVDHCDFAEQVSEDTESGRQRPDMLIKLPDQKTVVVDAKVPLAAYLDAIEASDETVRREKLKDHARQVRQHIQQLSRKSYYEQFEPTPEFVVLFLVNESSLYAALECDPALIEDGITDKVILATPTTLIAMLKAIAYGWRQESLTKNAKVISELGAELYKRLATVGDHFTKLGKSLSNTVTAYNDSVGSLERNVLTSARRLRDQHISSSDRTIEELKQNDVMPRVLQSSELFPATGGALPVSE